MEKMVSLSTAVLVIDVNPFPLVLDYDTIFSSIGNLPPLSLLCPWWLSASVADDCWCAVLSYLRGEQNISDVGRVAGRWSVLGRS